MRDILSRNVFELNRDLYNDPGSNETTPIERPYETFFLLAIAMFVLYVTICEIITSELFSALDSYI